MACHRRSGRAGPGSRSEPGLRVRGYPAWDRLAGARPGESREDGSRPAETGEARYAPALEALYSEFDRLIGHWRRYSKASLRAVVEAAGFEVVDLRFANSLGAVAWFVFCRLLGGRTSRTWVVQAWDRLAVPVLRRAERVVRPPLGSSLFCAAVRRPQ